MKEHPSVSAAFEVQWLLFGMETPMGAAGVCSEHGEEKFWTSPVRPLRHCGGKQKLKLFGSTVLIPSPINRKLMRMEVCEK